MRIHSMGKFMRTSFIKCQKSLNSLSEVISHYVYLLREISQTLALHCALDGAPPPRPAPGLVLHGVLSGGDVTAPSINLDSIKLKRRVASPHHSSRGRHIPEHAQFDFVAKHTLLL